MTAIESGYAILVNEYRQEQEDRERQELKNRHLRAVDNLIKSDEFE